MKLSSRFAWTRFLALGGFFAASAQALPAAPSLPADAPAVRPLRALAYTPEAILEVREQVRDNGANAALVAEILKAADAWRARSDSEVQALVPPPGSLFAYGTAGDPKTNQAWPRFGRSDDMCSFDRPGTVRSPRTGDIYGNARPGEPYYDNGKGWTRKSDGQVFYFKGIWNSWVVDQLHAGVENLSMAYLLTGKADYANRALFILDRLSSLRASLPLTGESVPDWPHSPIKDAKGFFHYMGNLANQRTITTAYAFDLIGNAPLADAPSPTTRGLSVRDNISRNYFGIYERAYYYDTGRSLTNHGTILLANLITQGVLLGDPGLLKDGFVGMRGFFDNTINRDGDYMEVSGSYGRLGRDYGSRLIAPLVNYRPENYSAEIAARMPKVGDYLSETNPGDDPRWFDTAVGMLWRLPVVNRYPQYGDMTMDRAVLSNRENTWLAKQRALYLRILYRQTTRPGWKHEIERLYVQASAQAKQVGSPLTLEELLIYGPSLWTEPPAPGESADPAATRGDRSDLMAGKGIAILRSGKGPNARALFIRGGFNSYHGHDDQMALVPYGDGMMLAGEFGYRWAGTPDHLGWGTRSVAHNTVVVDEDQPAPYLYKGFSEKIPAPAASITAFLPDERGSAQLIEMRNPQLYAKARLDEYRRAAWLVDADAERYYFVDVFQVSGGGTHDYVWTAPYANAGDRDGFRVAGVEPESRSGIWTLASVDNSKYRNEPWNKPGQSWGERLSGENGMVRPLAGEKKLPVSKWNPAPGNGYGMIWNVKLADTARDWQATWALPDGKRRMRAHLLNYDGMTAITALSPSMSPAAHFNPVIARRTRAKHAGGGVLRSRFVNVTEIARPEAWTIRSAAVLPLSPPARDAVGIRVTLDDGRSDYFVSSARREMLAADAAGLRTDARNAFVRTDKAGRLERLSLQDGTQIAVAGWKIEADSAALQAKVLSVQPGKETSRIVIDALWPDALGGQTLLSDSSTGGDLGYAHNDYYRIEEVAPDAGAGRTTLVFRDQSLVLASLNIEELNPSTGAARLYWMHMLAGGSGSFAYRGHGVVAKGQSADLQENPVLSLVRRIDQRDVVFSQGNKLKAGESVDVLVTKPGDQVRVPNTITLSPIAGEPGRWRLRSSVPVRVTLPGENASRAFPAGENSLLGP